MPREKPGYRDILDDLDRKFPTGCMLKTKDVCEFTGLCYNTVTKYFPIKKGVGISKQVLARLLAYEGA